jgi:lipopolysaccharide/colanic/teichoic acid biosynthesis glycosyltransferase
MIRQRTNRPGGKENFLDRQKEDELNAHRILDQIPLRDSRTGLYHEEFFNELLALEKKRCERSRSPVFLMLVDLSSFADLSERQKIAKSMMEALSDATGDTDLKGWHDEGLVIGIMFTEVAGKGATSPLGPRHIASERSECFASPLGAERFSRVKISLQVFPEQFPKPATSEGPRQKSAPPVAAEKKSHRRIGLIAKRLMDIIGSSFAIALFAPALVALAAWVKLGSKGSVLFRQERIGYGGRAFTMLKFRSMYTDNDPSIHKEFVKNLIRPGNGGDPAARLTSAGNYKIKGDPRVTRVGRILRKTSLDELPQFINVLKGDMSLVGPRPPIRYECESYDVWHRHRVLNIKPGITGLWQVTGRSVTTFDEMVRMDIKYIREWSLWLDVKIILKTPVVVLTGNGAY